MTVLSDDLRQLILEALGAQYTSVSCMDNIETGNHYQSVALGDFKTGGFREDRADLLDRIDFKGKRVLDLGSNLGEVSRAARARGAGMVDGFEYDPYFIEIAELINVYTGTTRVSFFERDISDEASFDQHYDIVLAFAVFGQGLRLSLPRVAEICDRVMVLETHRLEGNFDSTYMEPISEHFPYHRIIGQTQWGSPFDRREARAVMVFAKDEDALREAFGRTPAADERSATPRQSRLVRRCLVDIGRTNPHYEFFDPLGGKTGQELLDVLEKAPLDPENAAGSLGLPAGNDHWVHYLRGYAEYLRTERVGPGNPYYDHLAQAPKGDPSLFGALHDPAATTEYIARQYRDLEQFRTRAGDPRATADLAPIRALLEEHSTSSELVLTDTEGKSIRATRVDGWHRLFAARMWGIPALPCEVYEAGEVAPLRGVVDKLHIEGGRLTIAGWCLDPERRVDRIELSATGERIAGAMLAPRKDLRKVFPQVPHAADAGIEIDCDYDGRGEVESGVHRFDITAFHEFMPVGRMSAWWSPDAAAERAKPPTELASRLIDTTNAASWSLRALNWAMEMLDPVSRYKRLDSFRSVLDWGCRFGLIELHSASLLPGAEVTAVDPDREAVEWASSAGLPASFAAIDELPPMAFDDGAFELVLGPGMLPRIPADRHGPWLEELARVLQSGGYAALSVKGELAGRLLADPDVAERRRRDGAVTLAGPEGRTITHQTREHVVRECARHFEVVMYREGAVDNEQDLIVLRKA